MSGLFASLRAELLRARKSRALWIAAFLLFAISFLRVLAAHIRIQASHASRVQRALLEGSDVPDAPPIENAYGHWVDGWGAGLTVGVLLLVVHAARALAGDVETRLVAIQITRGVSRVQSALARFCFSPLLILGTVLATGAGAYVGAIIFFEFGPLVIDGFPILSAEELNSELTNAVLAALPPILATYTFGLLLSACSRSSTGAVSITLLSYLAFDLFKEVAGEQQYWIFAAYNPSFVDNSCLSEMSGVARGFLDNGYPDSLLRMNFTLPIPQALFLLGLTLFFFRRRAV